MVSKRTGSGGGSSSSSSSNVTRSTASSANTRSRHRPQPQLPQPTTDADNDLEEQACPICFETLFAQRKGRRQLLRGDTKTKAKKVWCDCGHAFCEDCLATYVRTSISEGRTGHGTVRCPVDKCPVPIQQTLIHDLVSSADWKKHLHLVEECKVAENPLLRHCSQPSCRGLARLEEAPAPGSRAAKQYLKATCRLCQHVFCANCGYEPHRWSICDGAMDKAYKEWKKSMGGAVKPCPGCGHHVEKTGGCSAMRCSRCQVCFCWICMKMRGCTCHNNDVYVHYPPPYGPVHAHGYGWREFREDALFAFGIVVGILVIVVVLVFMIGFFDEYSRRSTAKLGKAK